MLDEEMEEKRVRSAEVVKRPPPLWQSLHPRRVVSETPRPLKKLQV